MKGDFTRKTFDPSKHYSRVMMQQGRVQLDADFNEQAAILLYYLRTLAEDLGGPGWAPKDNAGFYLDVDSDWNIKIGGGRFYVDGILCRNDKDGMNYLEQESFSTNDARVKQDIVIPDKKRIYVAYLDVWERHITHLQDELIRESALGKADSCTRAKVVWQVRLLPNGEDQSEAAKKLKLTEEIANLNDQMAKADANNKKKLQADIDELSKQLAALKTELKISTDPAELKLWLDDHFTRKMPEIKAKLYSDAAAATPCSIPSGSRYRGVENQLYRIEVHRAGDAGTATFKWSRDNGSVVFPIVRQAGADVYLQSLGRDGRTGLKVGDWVEIMDDDLELHGIPGTMARVEFVDSVEMMVRLGNPDGANNSGKGNRSYNENCTNHPLLRRWDHKEVEGITLDGGAIRVKESESDWIEIEDGIVVQFKLINARYQTGDYWLIPARVATGDIEWPQDAAGEPVPEPPAGIHHHYAPLGILQDNGSAPPYTDCRCVHDSLPCWKA